MIRSKMNDKAFIIIGFVVIGIIFLLYSRISDFSITTDSIQSIERLATGFYIILFMSFGIIGYGIYRYHQRKVVGNSHDYYQLLLKLL